MFGTADLSRVKWTKTYAKIFKTRFALIDKDRDFEDTHVDMVIGDIRGMNVIIYDDMIRSGKSLVDAANAYLEKGATAVYAVASHLALTGMDAIVRLNCSRIQKIITTNSHPMCRDEAVVRSSPKFVVKDVSHLFVDAILKLTGKERE